MVLVHLLEGGKERVELVGGDGLLKTVDQVALVGVDTGRQPERCGGAGLVMVGGIVPERAAAVIVHHPREVGEKRIGFGIEPAHERVRDKAQRQPLQDTRGHRLICLLINDRPLSC